MTTMQLPQPPLPRVLGVLLVVVGAAALPFVAILVSSIRGARASWVLIGVVVFVSLKGYRAIIVGGRLLRNQVTPLIRPAEWHVLGLGYCLTAALLIMGALAGEGWGYAFAGASVGGLAPVWFAVARHGERDLKKSVASNSNSAVPGDGGEHA